MQFNVEYSQIEKCIEQGINFENTHKYNEAKQKFIYTVELLFKYIDCVKNTENKSKTKLLTNLYDLVEIYMKKIEALIEKNKYKHVLSSVVQIYSVSNEYSFGCSGSGVIISKDGFVISNFHVLNYDQNIFPIYIDVDIDYGKSEPKRKYTAKIVMYDKDYDLALLKIESNDIFPYLPISDSFNVEIGDDVNVFGFPFTGNDTITWSKGIISGFYDSFFKTDAKITSGNSGGPALDSNGCLIGIVTKGIIEEKFENDLGLIRPINYAKSFLDYCNISLNTCKINHPINKSILSSIVHIKYEITSGIEGKSIATGIGILFTDSPMYILTNCKNMASIEKIWISINDEKGDKPLIPKYLATVLYSLQNFTILKIDKYLKKKQDDYYYSYEIEIENQINVEKLDLNDDGDCLSCGQEIYIANYFYFDSTISIFKGIISGFCNNFIKCDVNVYKNDYSGSLVFNKDFNLVGITEINSKNIIPIKEIKKLLKL